MSNERRQGIYWLCTIPKDEWVPNLPPEWQYVRGQLERGNETGYEHWQVLVITKKKCSRRKIKSVFGSEKVHAELTYSNAANEYVWKEDTRIANSQFELGRLPINRNDRKDWESIWEHAKEGNIENIPGDVRIRSYFALRKIAADFARPPGIERSCVVFWGPTGTGKSKRAWEEGGNLAYPKDPRTKFWCGYRGEEYVIIDEFRGGFDVSHLLRWLDRYPVNVEIKGSSTPLRARRFWITSNLHPEQWYPDLDEETRNALLRRLEIKHFE